MLRWLSVFLVLWFLFGCSKNMSFEQKQAVVEQTLTSLKEARFKGRVRFYAAGSPLAFTAQQRFAFGPEQTLMWIEGDVDFSE